MNVKPIRAARPVEPDSDWETMRGRVMVDLAELTPEIWSDHNAVEPGVTVAEVALWGLADLHYRTERRGFDRWPMEVRAWEDDPQLHWHANLQVAGVLALATKLAADGSVSGVSVAAEIEPLIRVSASREEAVGMVADTSWGAVDFTDLEAAGVVDLMRGRLVRQLAMERTDRVARAIADAERVGGTVASIDQEAAEALAYDLPELWTSEIVAIVGRGRRRMVAERVASRARAILAVTGAGEATALKALMQSADLLTADEAAVAMGLNPTLPGSMPGDWERSGGLTKVWPPHPLQALTCEPVTAEDYARLARAAQLPSGMPPVRRAWAVAGRLPGVSWDGKVVTTADSRPGTVTLVVEPASTPSNPNNYLRAVLAAAIGSEVTDPHPTWRDTFDSDDPRRVICDEVGASVVVKCPVILKGRIVTSVGADRAALLAGALARVGAFFDEGRPESREPKVAANLIDGPWPNVPQPTDGWIPGEAIRVTEVIEVIVEDRSVLGVEDLKMSVDGGATFLPISGDKVSIAANCVPTLDEEQCLRVTMALGAECIDG